MNLPLTRVLTKIFVYGFYKVHAGQLLFLFVTLLSYLFYIQVLSDDHLTLEETILHNLKLVLTMVSSPIMAALMLGIFMIFSFKSWSYVSTQIGASNNFFLFYSANSYTKKQQFVSWLLVQLAIISPILVYSIFAITVGTIYGFYLIPMLILGFVLLIAAINARLYIWKLNRPIKSFENSFLLQFTQTWQKPLFSVFVFYVINKLKITFAVSKLLAISLTILMITLLNDFEEYQLTAIVALIISISNSILIFESHRFERERMSFLLNLPIVKPKIFASWLLTHFILLLPEIICLGLFFSSILWIYGVFAALSIVMMLRSSLLVVAVDMRKYLYWVFGLFILSIIIIQYHIFLTISFLYFGVSYLIFDKLFYR